MDALTPAANLPAGRSRSLIVAAMLISTFMAAAEVTIISTAMPTIVAELGGFDLFTWAFGIYLLGQAVTTPIYGRLADLYGRRAVYLGSTLLFLAGVAAMRPRLVHAVADRVPRHPGPGRRRAGAAVDHHPVRPVHAGAAAPGC